MSVLDRARALLGAEGYDALRERVRKDMRDNPPTEAQLTELARLLLMLSDSADRNLARINTAEEIQ